MGLVLITRSAVPVVTLLVIVQATIVSNRGYLKEEKDTARTSLVEVEVGVGVEIVVV